MPTIKKTATTIQMFYFVDFHLLNKDQYGGQGGNVPIAPIVIGGSQLVVVMQ